MRTIATPSTRPGYIDRAGGTGRARGTVGRAAQPFDFRPGGTHDGNPVGRRVFLAVGFALAVVGLAALVGWLNRADLDPRFAGNTFGERPPLQREWRLVDGKHWQIVAESTEDPAQTDAAEGNRGECMPGMIEIKGQMKVDPSPTAYFDGNSVEELQKTTCTRWINRDYPERCAEFDREKWLAASQKLSTKPMHYCIDRFEYPNRRGGYPVIMVNWNEAGEHCAAQGKRLCDEAEWTFACEGEEATPYPYGYVRDAEACVVDQKWKPFNEAAMQPRDGEDARYEMDRLWQGVASGSRPRCRSPFGVYDMTGNVDEWTVSVRDGERPSILKGGYWGPVRTRCRPSTRSHDEHHAFYQQSFRCCAAVGAEPYVPAVSLDPAVAPLPRELK